MKNTKPSNETLVLCKTTIIQFDGNYPRIEFKKTQSKLTSLGMYTSDETISKENQLVKLLIFFRLWSFIGSILLPYYHVAKEAIDWACLDLVLRPFLHIGWNIPPFTMFDYNCERTKVFIS